MSEFQLKGLFYNCDEKNFLGHKRKKQIFLWPFINILLTRKKNFHGNVIILIDSGNNHNFIYDFISQEINFHICVVNDFQIMIANGSSMKCGGHCENVFLQIGAYHLKSHMFSINMGGCDIVVSVEWLCIVEPILIDFKELTM
jgi:hypothetical protein